MRCISPAVRSKPATSSNASSLSWGASATMLAAQSFSVPPPHAELTRMGCSALRAVVDTARGLRLAGAAFATVFVVVTRPPPLLLDWIPGSPGRSPFRRFALSVPKYQLGSAHSSTHARSRALLSWFRASGSALPHGTISSRPHALAASVRFWAPGSFSAKAGTKLFPAPTRQPGSTPSSTPPRDHARASVRTGNDRGRCSPDSLVNQRICVDRT